MNLILAIVKDRLRGSCPFQPLMELLGRKHTLDVLYALFSDSPIRFSDIARRTSLNPRTLTDRLRDLEEAGIVERESFKEIPPRVEYHLTKKGRALARMFESLARWYRFYGEGGH